MEIGVEKSPTVTLFYMVQLTYCQYFVIQINLQFFLHAGTQLPFINVQNAEHSLTLTNKDDASVGPIRFPSSIRVGESVQTEAFVCS